MSYRPRYNNNGTLEDLPIDAETVKGHKIESTGIVSNTDTIPTTAQVKSYVDSNEKYHTPSSASGVKIATGTGVADMYVPTGTSSSTVCAGNDSRLSNSRTPTSHASSATTYGVGTSSSYGHVKVISGDLNGKSATNGYAASQSHSHSNYQVTLVSGTNIKTINNQSLLGSGNISIGGGGGSNLKLHFIMLNVYDEDDEGESYNDDYYTFLLPSTTVTSAITDITTLKTALRDAGATTSYKPLPVTKFHETSNSSSFTAVGIYASTNNVNLVSKNDTVYDTGHWGNFNITDTVIG